MNFCEQTDASEFCQGHSRTQKLESRKPYKNRQKSSKKLQLSRNKSTKKGRWVPQHPKMNTKNVSQPRYRSTSIFLNGLRRPVGLFLGRCNEARSCHRHRRPRSQPAMCCVHGGQLAINANSPGHDWAMPTMLSPAMPPALMRSNLNTSCHGKRQRRRPRRSLARPAALESCK